MTVAFRVLPFGTQADPQGSGHGRHSIYRSESGKLTGIESVNGVFALTFTDKPTMPFREYAERWLRTDAKRSKESTVDFYREYPARYVLPVFGAAKIDAISREAIKVLMADLSTRRLSRNTIRLAVAPLRVVLSSAVEDGLNSHESRLQARQIHGESKARA